MAFHSTIGRLRRQGTGGDPMGRWSFIHLKRHQRPPITIISICQVCINPTNAVGSTAWHQQCRALDMANRTMTHPRTAFMDDLINFISKLQQSNHSIIVGGIGMIILRRTTHPYYDYAPPSIWLTRGYIYSRKLPY